MVKNNGREGAGVPPVPSQDIGTRMKPLLLKTILLLSVMFSFGCVAQSGSHQAQITSSESAIIELECHSANRLGCRHKGNIYPWNAWVEAKGYDSLRYAVKDVNQSGNKATVLVVER